MIDHSERLLELLKSRLKGSKKVGFVIRGKSKLTFENKQVDCLYFVEMTNEESPKPVELIRFQVYDEKNLEERQFPWVYEDVAPFSDEEGKIEIDKGHIKIENQNFENGISSILNSDVYVQELDEYFLNIKEAYPIDLFFSKKVIMG